MGGYGKKIVPSLKDTEPYTRRGCPQSAEEERKTFARTEFFAF
jgi:hypothetical protein